MSKDTLKEKVMAAASATPTPQTKNTTTMNMTSVMVPNLYKLLGDYGKKWDIDKKIIDISEVLKEKLQFLLYGKPLIIESDNEADNVKELVEEIKLQETLFAAEADTFNHGSSTIVIEKIGSKIQLSIADPNFPNVVRKMGNVIYEAEVWTAFKFERTQYWKRTIYSEKFIRNDVYGSESGQFADREAIKLKEFNKKIESEALQIKAKVKNPFGIIPVVQTPYVPTRDYSTSGLKELAPKSRIEGIQVLVDEGFKALRKELLYNTTRTLIDRNMLDSNDEATIGKLMNMGIWAVLSDSGHYDGTGKVVEVLMGDPKVSSYWENITNSISLAVQALKLSELTSEDSTTATDAIFSKGNDVETINTLSTFRQNKIAELLAKAEIMKTGSSSTEAELDISKWGVMIVPNVIMNEAKMTDIVIKQLGAGLINMVQAKVKLENISKEDAETMLSEEENHLNPTLNAMNGFGDDGEEDKDTNGAKPAEGENKPKPE